MKWPRRNRDRPARIPVLPPRHPYEVFLTSFLGFGCIPSALGVAPIPPSMVQILGPNAGRAWVIALVVGAVLVGVGIGWKRPVDPRMLSVTALVLEQIGLTVMGVAAGLYGWMILAANGWQGFMSAVFLLGYGAASLSLVGIIQRFLNYRARQVRETS